MDPRWERPVSDLQPDAHAGDQTLKLCADPQACRTARQGRGDPCGEEKPIHLELFWICWGNPLKGGLLTMFA